MTRAVPSPFQAIDHALAERIAQWHNTDDALLKQSVLAVSYALQQGHSCLSLAQCLDEAPYRDMAQFGWSAFPALDDWQAQLAAFGLGPEDDSPLVLHNQRLYLRRYWQFETELQLFLSERYQQPCSLTKAQLERARTLLADYFQPTPGTTDWQQVAAANSLFSSVSTIIGGPGTGKTHTVTRILALLAGLSDQPLVIKLAAPTGKAAQRLAEAIRDAKAALNLDMLVAQAIPNEAHTLHRLLGVIPNRLQFRHQADNPIEADVLLIDEVSMVDLPLMARLFRALKPTTRLILLGDADQLPSVAAGSVLADLVRKPHPGYSRARIAQFKAVGIKLPVSGSHASSDTTVDSPLDSVTELTLSRRFADGSGIGALAQAVIRGDAAASLAVFSGAADLTWLGERDLNDCLQGWIRNHYRAIAEQPDLHQAFAHLKTFRILCAHRDGERGVTALNDWISQRLNPSRQPFFKGQPIMVTQNHYGLKLFNGDVGLVWPNEAGQLMVWFEAEGEPRPVTPGRLPAFETVYAMTIHKTQGSEFDEVALVLPDHQSQLLSRELIYTGLTRAKQRFSCLGSEPVWRAGVTARVDRWAGLAGRLHG